MGLGIIPAAGGSQTIPRIVGRGYAMEMLLSGRWITSAEAKKIKMVNRVVARAELLPTVESWRIQSRGYNLDALEYAKRQSWTVWICRYRRGWNWKPGRKFTIVLKLLWNDTVKIC